jgi:hypothetical protein
MLWQAGDVVDRSGVTRSNTMVTGCQVRRDGETVRLFTRRGYDWSERYPAITAAALRCTSLTHRGFGS